MTSSVIRRTAVGALVVGGLFGTVALVQVLRTEVSPLQVLEALVAFVILGATIGGLGGPLVGAAWARWRGTDDAPSSTP